MPYRVVQTIRGGDDSYRNELEAETLETAIELADSCASRVMRIHVDVFAADGFHCYRVSFDTIYRSYKREHLYLRGVDVVIESTLPRLRPFAFA